MVHKFIRGFQMKGFPAFLYNMVDDALANKKAKNSLNLKIADHAFMVREREFFFQ
jgi:hypothetical protein